MAAPLQFKKQPNGTFAPINQIGPHIADSTNWKTWAPVDKSGVTLDIAKLATMPTSAQECGPVQIEINEHGLETTRYYECAWSQASDFLQWAYGYSYVQTTPADPSDPESQPTNKLRRIIPAQDVNYPYLYCDNCRLEQCKGAVLPDPGALMTISGKPVDYAGNVVPVGDQDQGLWPGVVFCEKASAGNVNFLDGNAYFRVRYRSRPYPVRNDADADAHPLKEQSRFVQVRRQYAIQALALSKIAAVGNTFQFAARDAANNPISFNGIKIDGAAIPEAGVLLMPTESLEVTWHELPFDPQVGIEACMGRVNAADFTIAPGWGPFSHWTLLCQAPETRGPYRNAAGVVCWDCKLRLDYRNYKTPDGVQPQAQGWIVYPAPDRNFYFASFGKGGETVYEQQDFTQLFQPQPAPAW